MSVNVSQQQIIEQFNDSITTAGPSAYNHPLCLCLDYLDTKYDSKLKVIWCILKSSLSPTFSPLLLQNIRTFQDSVAQYCMQSAEKPKYMVWLSDNQKIFSLGLDLGHIYQSVINKNEDELRKYLELCIDVLYINIMKLEIDPLITISLMRGKTYGGGFEAALTSDIIVAEPNVRCSFPGLQYNLLPSIGTLRILFKRFPQEALEALLLGGKSLHADDLQHYKIVNMVSKINEGEADIHKLIKKINERHDIYSAVYKAIRANYIITQTELEEFKESWIQMTMNLRSSDLSKLERIVRAQHLLGRNFAGPR